MRKLLILAVILLICTISSYGQGELNPQQKVFFRNEKSFAILLNSDGAGVSYRSAKRIDFRNKNLFEIDAGTLRHIKEYKQSSTYVQGNSFIFGKLNSTFFLRAGLGHQHEIYKKADLGGIAVRYFYSGGPVLAIYKPIYYKVVRLVPGSGNQFDVIPEKFNSSIASPTEIYSKASFTRGLNETKVMPGLYAKAGLNFEYSKEDKIIHAIEFGGQVNAFPFKIPIMFAAYNKKLFFSLFVSYRFGLILDPLDPDSNKLTKFFGRKRKIEN